MADVNRPMTEHDRLVIENTRLRLLLTEAAKSYECFVLAGPDPKPEDQWDEYDSMMAPIWRKVVAEVGSQE